MDIERIFSLYRAGARPPLDELISSKLLEIFQRGVVQKKLSSFGILLPAPDEPEDSNYRWLNGKFINVSSNWVQHCTVLRAWRDKKGSKPFDRKCDKCDREHAIKADEFKEPIIYLCHAGMVDYALPIIVDDHTMAVLFAGQECPAKGNIWSANFINTYATKGTINGSEDVQSETIKRNNTIMKEMQLLYPGTNPPDLEKLVPFPLNKFHFC